MTRICCIYFSPTGGTRLIAESIAKAMAERLCLPMETFDITVPEAREKVLSFSAEDLVLVASPTYAGRVPNKMLPEFERMVQGAANTPAVIVSVYGGRSNDEGLRELLTVVEKNGFKAIAAASCVARHSMSRSLAAGRPDEKDLAALAEFGRRVAEKADEAPEAVAFDRDTPIAPYYKPLKEDLSPAVFLKAKPLTHADKCIKCALCAASCPMGSISYEDYCTVPGVCIKCHACVRNCPTGAKYFDNEDLLSHIRMLEANYKGEQEYKFYI